ncbi:MAG: phospholipase D-like domain-containing protein [Candidatus Doudnabacteria bacterium]
MKLRPTKDALYFIVISILVAMASQFYYDYKYIPQTSREVKVYYNKETQANLHLISAIEHAEQYIYFAIYTFTRTDIKDALLAAKYRGLEVKGIVDQEQTAKIPEQNKIVSELRSVGIPIYHQNHTAIMHLKTLVTDQSYVSGSYNWTTSATDFNDEVIQVGRDPDIKKQYERILKSMFQKYQY